ncbi:peptidoglycan-binding protein [Aestuariimicrobium soli]|uniref:peptidoglycan-binding protein n=1 Tax=Aestuariimicrobium soli TaxID=2035834 RepID=UPI003EC10EBB
MVNIPPTRTPSPTSHPSPASTVARTTRVLAVLAMAMAVTFGVAGQAQATWYPRSAYPAPARAYVTHPAGFSDSTMVVRTSSGLRCNVPLAAAAIPGTSVNVRKELAPLVKELMRRTEAMGYNIGANTWGYNCRYVRGSTTSISNHAYGRAIDINSESNPMSTTFQSNIPPAVVKMWINHGFYWGGHYSTRYDTMHFEYVGTLSQIGTFYRNLTGQPMPTPPAPCPSLTLGSYPTIKQGHTGTAVKVIQCQVGATPDGVFGAVTTSKVKTFQSSRGLVADGVVGPKTWTAALSKGTTPVLQQGSSGASVSRLQRSLRARGYTIAVDGSFGTSTRSTVIAYQKRVGLVGDGVVGAKTWSALQHGR